MKAVAIILAGGKGKRMNSNIPKQYIDVNGKTILEYTLDAFEKSNIDEIVLVCGEDDKEMLQDEILKDKGYDKVKDIVCGGKERYDSVYNGLKACNNAAYVLVHDGARPLIRTEIINNMINVLPEKKACILAVRAKDTIKMVENDKVISTMDRSKLWMVQTPQGFEFSKLKKAYDEFYSIIEEKDKLCEITDDAMVIEKFSDLEVNVLEGDYENIKITTISDLEYMKRVLKNRE